MIVKLSAFILVNISETVFGRNRQVQVNQEWERGENREDTDL